MVNPSVEYPAAFGKQGQLVGMLAARDVPPMTAFLYIPQKIMINEANARIHNPRIGEIFDKHPNLFKTHLDAEYLTLIFFVMTEMIKGKDSFWHPFFQIINFTDLPMHWTLAQLGEL